MESIKTHAYIDDDGVLRLELPTSLSHRHIEVLVVIQPLEEGAVDDMGYPIGYFEKTYGMFADNPIEEGEPPRKMTPQEWARFINKTYGSLADDPTERGEQPPYDVRDAIE